MSDFGLGSAGTEVAFASCMDERHPPENIVDGSDRTFWVTTGLYPHQIILAFSGEIELDKIKTVTTNIRKLKFESCTQTSPTEFQEIYDVEVADRNGRVQAETNQIPGKPKARFLRVTIMNGWDDFASIRRISIEGAKT
mmetsp:Transcript_92666/g.135444  ORF Transcript_92666/g.135444 Transcript_92666/m.135444 type:complete len:139 (+) Transcript_92666:45-461(+)|eukprot:CAMPEP_0179439544 /NCGR_PEP_ID=MMETSP0799-20121207/23175_1 /TAXON_ID=46947 /ORGANISM="Geminigera cryophila, Strain CCMP2564" /LENGTH=138 /DNA_ID=CAMNT_0021222063 /DNA_START=120 /DNA_END=536 /DNA_ORIENTATION=+